jgi:hypothetical protein
MKHYIQIDQCMIQQFDGFAKYSTMEIPLCKCFANCGWTIDLTDNKYVIHFSLNHEQLTRHIILNKKANLHFLSYRYLQMCVHTYLKIFFSVTVLQIFQH